MKRNPRRPNDPRRRRIGVRLPGLVLVLASLLWVPACSKPDVVIYVSLDKIFSEQLIQEFEKETGLRVEARYDLEAVKTVGLVKTLVEEKDHPRADVFWNNELGNTVKLKNMGLLEPYRSPNAESIPSEFKDPDGTWTGLAARARILIVNNDLVPEERTPTSMYDLLDPEWKGRCGIAKPLAGTTFTHFTALRILLGDAKWREYLDGLRSNEVRVATGNAHLMRQVADGQLAWGFTDTDDFHVALTDGKPVRPVYPDQGEGQLGTMLIPNSVMLIKNGPNPENGKRLIDFILRPETERKLAFSRSAQIPLHPGVDKPEHVRVPGADFRAMNVDYDRVGAALDETAEILTEEFLR
jgi:iron(III) transport system substrate-binding protein